MSKKKNLVVANWKMNPRTSEEAKAITGSIKRFGAKLKKTEVVIAPSFIHIPLVAKMLERNRKIFLGAQNVHLKPFGPHTGEVGMDQIKDYKVRYVIVGHSERRAAGESDEIINQKMRALLSQNFTPILCFGEKERDKDGNYLNVVKQQLLEDLRDVPKKDLLNIVLAYEPVWAIGKSFRESMTATDMHEMALFIRKILTDAYGVDYSKMPILYGGSVESENALDLMKEGAVSGFLVGHASSVPDDFKKILREVDSLK